jgi:hypothetical protein
VHVGLDGAVEFFYKTEKIAAFDSKKRTHLAYTERRRNGKGFATDLFPISLPNTSNSLPDIFTLLLT